jgi:hypothetical protein
MKERRMVVLLGDSLLMDTVEASLEDNQSLGIARIDTAVTDAGTCLKSLAPDLIIFDFDAPHLQCVICYLRDHPGVPLLGLDVTCNKVIVLSSQQRTTLTADDLAQVILMQIFYGGGEDEQLYMWLAKLGKGFLRFSLN